MRWFGWITATAGREASVAGALALALFLAGTADVPILGRDEARFAQAAREMLDRGDLVVPTFAGQDRYHKPILHYWCTMASFRLLGATERAARLPSNLAGALVVALLAMTARRRFDAGSGLLAGLLLAVTPVMWIEAKACTADMVLLLPTLAAMLAFERLLAGDGGRRAALVFWSAMAVAILAKGPVAPAWVACTGLALWAMGRRWRGFEIALGAVLLGLGWWRLGPVVLVVPAVGAGFELLRSPDGRRAVARLHLGWGVPLMLAITLPWAVAATVATDGAFLREAVGRHVVARGLDAFEGHGFFPGFYAVTAVVAASPWLGLLAGAGSPRQECDRRWRYLVAWLVGPLVLLELYQTKLVHYWLPSYPAGVLLVVGWLFAAVPPRRTGLGGRSLHVLGGTLAALALLALPAMIPLRSLLPAAAVAAGLLLAATVAAVALLGRRPIAGAVVGGIGSALALAVVAVLYLPELGRHALGPLAARRAIELKAPGEEIVVFKPRVEEVFFYLPRGVVTCRDAGCVASLVGEGTAVLGVGRRDDVELLAEEWRGARVVEVDRVVGVDVGRAGLGEQVLFRVDPLRPRPRAAAGAGVDSRRAGP
ncbi:MAG TPA: glycosyltransferase family 39 protein [Thermoanaerobaculales bacterium]|nr:glycosyltransferase family 39 protein [Thermoanaerobaculales bacterium]